MTLSDERLEELIAKETFSEERLDVLQQWAWDWALIEGRLKIQVEAATFLALVSEVKRARENPVDSGKLWGAIRATLTYDVADKVFDNIAQAASYEGRSNWLDDLARTLASGVMQRAFEKLEQPDEAALAPREGE